MGFLARGRGAVTPVRVVRVPPETDARNSSYTPGSQIPQPPPAPSASAAPTIIYVTIPPAAQPQTIQAPAPAPHADGPAVVNYHTHHYHASRRSFFGYRMRRGANLFGLAAVCFALFAMAVIRFHIQGFNGFTVAACGVCVGALGIVSSEIFGRSGKFTSVLAILINFYAIAMYTGLDGWAYQQIQTLRGQPAAPSANAPFALPPSLTNTLNNFLGKAPAPNPTGPSQPPPAATGAPADTTSGMKTSFNPGVVQQITSAAAFNIQSAQSAVDDARRKAADADSAVIARLSSNPAYVQAKANVDQAAADLQKLRDSANSPDLAPASEAWIADKNDLAEIIDNAENSDPACAAAHKSLLDAAANLRQIREKYAADQGIPGGEK